MHKKAKTFIFVFFYFIEGEDSGKKLFFMTRGEEKIGVMIKLIKINYFEQVKLNPTEL